MCCYSCKAFFRRVVNTYKVFEFYYYYLMPSIMSHFTRNRILICKLSAGHFFLSGFYIIALPSYQPGHNLSGPNLILSSVSPSCSTLRCPSDFWVTGTGFIISVQTLLRISKQTRSLGTYQSVCDHQPLHVLQVTKYTCRSGTGQCDVSLANRRSCQACRYKKCIAAGMKPGLVLSDDQCNKR